MMRESRGHKRMCFSLILVDFLFVHFWLVDLKQCFAFSLVIYFLKLTSLGMFWPWQCLCLLFAVLARVLVLFAFGNVPLFYFWQCFLLFFLAMFCCFILFYFHWPTISHLPSPCCQQSKFLPGCRLQLQQNTSSKEPQLETIKWFVFDKRKIWKLYIGIMVGHLTDQPSEKWGAISEWSRSQCFR